MYSYSWALLYINISKSNDAGLWSVSLAVCVPSTLQSNRLGNIF